MPNSIYENTTPYETFLRRFMPQPSSTLDLDTTSHPLFNELQTKLYNSMSRELLQAYKNCRYQEIRASVPVELNGALTIHFSNGEVKEWANDSIFNGVKNNYLQAVKASAQYQDALNEAYNKIKKVRAAIMELAAKFECEQEEVWYVLEMKYNDWNNNNERF